MSLSVNGSLRICVMLVILYTVSVMNFSISNFNRVTIINSITTVTYHYHHKSSSLMSPALVLQKKMSERRMAALRQDSKESDTTEEGEAAHHSLAGQPSLELISDKITQSPHHTGADSVFVYRWQCFRCLTLQHPGSSCPNEKLLQECLRKQGDHQAGDCP